MSELKTYPKSELSVKAAIERLVEIMARLRSPNGCPWDSEQTPESLKPYIIEEAYEVLDAIDRNDPDAIRDELGDLLLQVVFQARIFEERGQFSLTDVASAISDKLIRRHPHVFADTPTGDAQTLSAQWEAIKASEQVEQGKLSGRLDDIPRHLPALQMAQKLIKKNSTMRTTAATSLLADVSEILGNLANDIDNAQHSTMDNDIGKLLFTITRLGSGLDINVEQSLRKINNNVIANYNANFKDDHWND